MNRARRRDKYLGILCALSAGALYGTASPTAQYLFEEGAVVPAWLVPYRLLAAGLLLMGFNCCKRLDLRGIWRDRRDRVQQIALSVFGIMGMQYTCFSAVQEMNASLATIFQYTSPAVLIGYFAFVHGVRPQKKEITAVACMISGIVIVVTHGKLGQMAISSKGAMFGVLLALTTCCYGIIAAPLLQKFPAETVSAWGMLIGGAVLSIFLRPWAIQVEIRPAVLVAFFYIVIMGTIIPGCLSMLAVKKIGALYAGLFSSIEIVTATMLSASILNSEFQRIDILGIVLILLATIIVNVDFNEVKKHLPTI